MGKALKEYWFGILLLTAALLFLIFAAIVAAAPHDDAKMRGFTPCTYRLAQELSLQGAGRRIWGVLGAVGESYVCYAGVVADGVGLWLDGKQPAPWSNYFFESENFKIPPVFGRFVKGEPAGRQGNQRRFVAGEEVSRQKGISAGGRR